MPVPCGRAAQSWARVTSGRIRNLLAGTAGRGVLRDITPREQAILECTDSLEQSSRGPRAPVGSRPGLELTVAVDPVVGALPVGRHRVRVGRGGVERTPRRRAGGR